MFQSFLQFFEKLEIFQITIFDMSKSKRRSDFKPLAIESEGHFNAKNHSADKKFYRVLPQKRIPIFRYFSDFYSFLKNWKFFDFLSIITRKVNVVAISNQLHSNRKDVLMLRITRPTKNFIVFNLKKESLLSDILVIFTIF